ncbi:hypothetical protein ES703_54905 [subsurface metagenome]
MTIESPETYGEEYWKSQLDATTAFSEVEEDSIKPLIPSIFSDPEIRAAIPFDVLPKLERLFEFEHAGLSAVGGRFVSEVADQTVSMVMGPPLRRVQYAANRMFQNMVLTPDQATALLRRKRLADTDYINVMSGSGFGPGQSMLAYNVTSPFPSVPELFRWARHHGDPDNTWGTLVDYVDLDPIDYPKWEWLTKQVWATDQITSMYRREKIEINDAIYLLREVGWSDDDAGDIIDLSFSIPNAMLLLQGNLQAKEGIETIFNDLGHADIHPEYRQKYIDAVLTKPSSSDVIAYELRQENDLANLDVRLTQIGVHPDWLDTYKTLASRIPPVADIISMAVREAFTPSIAARFGQYEDFPTDFGKYAAQQGLSLDWARRYWAAHWGLPSPQQGFEMLHRGVIGVGDLEMLMKAQDIMPFWRDKMTAIAYRTLTRVDVRRMYELGVLDRRGVYESYQDAGYSDENAERMTDFTEAYIREKQTHSAQEDIIKAFSQRMIDRSEASSLLTRIGLAYKLSDYLLDDIEYKREWDRIDAQIKGIRNLYKKGQYDLNTTTAELSKLDLPANTITLLMEQWWYEIKAIEVKTWSKAETIRFMKSGVISKERGEVELYNMGYDKEHVDVYIGAIEWT